MKTVGPTNTRHTNTVQDTRDLRMKERQLRNTIQAEVAPNSAQVTTEQSSQYKRNRRDTIRLPDPSDKESSDTKQKETETSSTTMPSTSGLRQSSCISRLPKRFAPYIIILNTEGRCGISYCCTNIMLYKCAECL